VKCAGCGRRITRAKEDTNPYGWIPWLVVASLVLGIMALGGVIEWVASAPWWQTVRTAALTVGGALVLWSWWRIRGIEP
jgi:hypothetical protein